MACEMARMWASVKVPLSGVPRCPLVPKLTNWFGSPRSGRRSKYSLSSRVKSTNISLGAGCPARGEIAVMDSLSQLLKPLLPDRTWLRVPDGGRVLGDGAVAPDAPCGITVLHDRDPRRHLLHRAGPR